MQKILKFGGIAAVIFLATGCSSSMSVRASKVRIVTADDVKGMEFLGPVEGSSIWTGTGKEVGYDNALNEMLDKAAAKGATEVVLDPNSGPSYWTTSEIARGQAYRTKPGAPDTGQADPVETELRRLQKLHDDKLISDDEYRKLREQCLNSTKKP